MLLWDQGTWEPQAGHEDVDSGLRDGSLKFILHGKKMKGKWALIRMGGRAAKDAKPNWLLIKEHDEFERSPEAPAITDEKPESVVTGRGLENIAKDGDHVWNAKETGSNAKKTAADLNSTPLRKNAKSDPTQIDLNTFPAEKLPQFVAPQLAVQADSATDGAGWIHELKLDGYRIQAIKSKDRVLLKTRTGLDWTHRMKSIAQSLKKVHADQALMDGEVVALDDNGLSSFANLQAAFQEGATHELTYFVFDLLHLNGHNLRNAPLMQRKELLTRIVGESVDQVRVSEHIEGSGTKMFEGACALHAEGIVSKRASGVYRSGRSSDWVKVKCKREQELVIGGFTLPRNGPHGIGALLLGYYDESSNLIYAGRTGTGFTRSIHTMLRDRLDNILQKEIPFRSVPRPEQRGVKWVKPTLVAQVSFATWTADHLVRQAAFKGLREDKPAVQVRREDLVSSQINKPVENTTKKSAVKRTQAATVAKVVAKNREKKSIEHPPIRLTHPDKVLDAETGVTKQQLADYYWAVADAMLAEIARRPLSLVRCPEGFGTACFFQKHTSTSLPPGVETVEIPDKKTGKIEPYITLSTAEALTGLAQMGVLEIHPWGCHNDDLEHPDRIIFDLDPDEAISWRVLANSAEEVRRLLKQLSLESYLKSTGGKGLHVVVPIVARHDWTSVKGFAHSVALQLAKLQPDLYLTKMSKAARKGRIFIDYLRNDRGSTAVAAYSPRARVGAPVAVPMQWNELKQAERPSFAVSNFADWKIRLKTNVWKGLDTIQQSIGLKAAEHLRVSNL